MIKLTILYPNAEGATFDLDYYLNVHVPMAHRLLAPAIKSFTVDSGVLGGGPDVPPPFLAIGEQTYESVEAFMEVFMPNAEALQGDIPKFTNVSPVIQFSEMKIG